MRRAYYLREDRKRWKSPDCPEFHYKENDQSILSSLKYLFYYEWWAEALLNNFKLFLLFVIILFIL